MKIDVKDRKILHELSRNCRTPTTRIAKKVGLSQQTTDYRINRLVKNNIIADFVTEIDIEKLGFTRHIMYLQLKKVDEKKEQEIIQYFVEHPFLTWVVTSTGKWSLIFDIIAHDLGHANEIVEEMKEKYGEFIGEYKIASQVDYRYFHSKYYGFKEQAPTKEPNSMEHETDYKDLKLLKLLARNARMDYAKLSENLNLTANTIKDRIRKLVKSGIIKSFHIVPNKTLLGYEQHYVQFTFEQFNKEQERQLMAYIISHPNVNVYYKPIGHWDLEIGFFVDNPGELRKIILDMRNKFSDIIKIYDSMLFYEEPKSNFTPDGVFER